MYTAFPYVPAFTVLPVSLVQCMQVRKPAPKEWVNGTVSGCPGQVKVITNCPLSTSLTSLAIILPVHLHLLSLAFTF
jgi:hypothetical protein